MKQQAQRERERVEEGLRLSRERAAEKARAEAAALEKLNREKKELEDKKEVQSERRGWACACCRKGIAATVRRGKKGVCARSRGYVQY